MEEIKAIAERLVQSLPYQENTQDLASQVCAKCGGTGYSVDGKQMAHRCACMVEKRIRSRLPKMYWKARLEDFSDEILSKVFSWFVLEGSGLRLSGPVGTGKTHLAAAIVRHVEEENKTAKFHTFSSVYRDLRECFSKHQSEREVLKELFTCPFLVLDDLGAGGLSDFERRSTLDILDERGMKCLPTVITANWSLEEIAKRMDDRIASRMSSFTFISMDGADRRPQKGQP